MNAATQGEVPMSPVWETVLAKYGWILIGITFGFAAKYAMLLKRGVKVQARLVFADLLLLPMVALLAYWIASRVGFEGDAAALAAAFCTVGADRLIKMLTDRFLQRVDNEARMLAGEQLGEVRNLVQAERSAHAIVADTIEGRAPSDYVALKPHPQKPTKRG